jgi:hypothetical protein
MRVDNYANIIKLSFQFSHEVTALNSIASHPLMMYFLQAEYQSWGTDHDKQIDLLTGKLVNQFTKINETIKELNKSSTKLKSEFFLHPISLVDFNIKGVRRNLTLIFNKIEANKGQGRILAELVENNYKAYINEKIRPSFHEISAMLGYIDIQEKFILKNTPLKYQNQINEVIDLVRVGYNNTALLVLGMVFEEIFTKLLLKNAKKLKLKHSVIKTMKFTNRLEVLKSHKIISYKDSLLFSKLIWDRDTGGHYFNLNSRKIEAKKEAFPTIKLCALLIPKYDRKLK